MPPGINHGIALQGDRAGMHQVLSGMVGFEQRREAGPCRLVGRMPGIRAWQVSHGSIAPAFRIFSDFVLRVFGECLSHHLHRAVLQNHCRRLILLLPARTQERSPDNPRLDPGTPGLFGTSRQGPECGLRPCPGYLVSLGRHQRLWTIRWQYGDKPGLPVIDGSERCCCAPENAPQVNHDRFRRRIRRFVAIRLRVGAAARHLGDCCACSAVIVCEARP